MLKRKILIYKIIFNIVFIFNAVILYIMYINNMPLYYVTLYLLCIFLIYLIMLLLPKRG